MAHKKLKIIVLNIQFSAIYDVAGMDVEIFLGKAYPEIFRGGFEFFLFGGENLGGFFLKNPSKLKKIPKKRVDHQNPSLNMPLSFLMGFST